MAVNKYKVGDMFYFGPHRTWGVVTKTYSNAAFQFVDYVLMSPKRDKPKGMMHFRNESDSAIKFTNAIAQGNLEYFPAKGKSNG